MSGYFNRERTRDGEIFTPTTDAVSGWGALVRGPAMTSLLARTIERVVIAQTAEEQAGETRARDQRAGETELGVELPGESHTDAAEVLNSDHTLDSSGKTGGLVPAKTTFDLHSPLPLVPVMARANVLRNGRRLKLVDAELIHDGRVYARARSLWLKRDVTVDVSDNTPWSPSQRFTTPNDDPWNITDDGRIYWSERLDGRSETAAEADGRWSDQGFDHQNAARKAVWQFPVPTVVGEELTGFEVAANVCDVANLATGWGPQGLDFINADATLSLVRYPTSTKVGVTAIDRIAQDGIAIGTAALYDTEGQFANAQVTQIVQPGGRIQFPDPTVDASNKLTRPHH